MADVDCRHIVPVFAIMHLYTILKFFIASVSSFFVLFLYLVSLRWNGGRQQRVSPSLICFLTRPVLKGPTLQQNKKKQKTKNNNANKQTTTKQTKQIIRLRNLITILLLLIFVYGLRQFFVVEMIMHK